MLALSCSHSLTRAVSELVPGLGAVDKSQTNNSQNFGNPLFRSRAAEISLTTALIPQCFRIEVTLFRSVHTAAYERHESSERDA